MRRGALFLMALSGAVLLSLASSRTLRSQTQATEVGDETCSQCHKLQTSTYLSSPHGRASREGGEGPHCETCHGAGSLHAAAAGDTTDPGFRTIHNPAKMSYQASSEACSGCHKGGEQFYWEHSNHARAGVGCLNCHSTHHKQNAGGGPMLTATDVNQLCLSCHTNKRAGLARSGHMPLREGSMNCADCHNPHGSAGEHQLRGATVNELCTKCHADKRGPYLWEHPPVRENCLNCHQPHGSNNEQVLAAKRPYLCQRCHIGTRHPSTLYDNPDLTTNRLFNRSCQNCHSQVHGSNHPCGKYLER
jgi:DmsE family decaheme c-type cytochrome